MVKKPLAHLVWLLLAVLMTQAGAFAAQNSKSGKNTKQTKTETSEAARAKAPEAATHTVVVYYFYTEPRCDSCKKIEAFTKEALNNKFATELKSGRLVWMPIDVKKEGNWHYVEEFKITSKSVIAADYKGEKPNKDQLLNWKNLEQIWPLLKDKPKFIEYIQSETQAYLSPVKKDPEPDKGKDQSKDKTESKSKK